MPKRYKKGHPFLWRLFAEKTLKKRLATYQEVIQVKRSDCPGCHSESHDGDGVSDDRIVTKFPNRKFVCSVTCR